ncbi:hypothetical protein V8C37DRAFT_363850 [Trichoderma ceciliae]
MGAQESKPQGHAWKVSGPPSVSLPVIESLQTSPETDASRARLVEQHIQARVAEELKRLQKQESNALKFAHDKIAETASSDTEDKGLTRYIVGKEVGELRSKLEQRRKVQDLPEGVEAARNNVIRCLRENDRRPLVCYDEVEAFKAEVKKMEKDWINRITA